MERAIRLKEEVPSLLGARGEDVTSPPPTGTKVGKGKGKGKGKETLEVPHVLTTRAQAGVGASGAGEEAG